ncbi:tail fiber domain-containing protein [Salmonella enterica]|nr:tail fiber domain-containing protein [Salmonella enterica]
MRSWLTALDEVTLEAADGTEIKVKSLLQIVNEHNENQQWYRDHVDTIESESSKALDAAARSEAAAAEALNSKQAAAGSEANAKASENAAAASQQAAATSESNARASKEAAAASQTAALQSEQAAAASQNAAHQSEESAANSKASALASKEAASVSQTAAANSEQAAKASEAEAARYANDSLAYSNNAKASQDAAAESQASALESKNTAVASKDAAAASQAAAAASETNAAAHADTAKSEAEKAKQFADLLDVNNVLHKDQNLADLPDRSAARKTLQVQAVISRDPEINGTQGDYNSFTNPQSTYELRIANNGEWRVARNDNNSTSALSIGAGGTGATDVSRAKKNFELERFVQTSNSTVMRFGTFGLNLTSDGTWGVTQSGVSGWIPLGMAQGGTGATTLDSARINLNVDRLKQQDNGTFLQSKNGFYSLFIYDSGDWGFVESASAQVRPLKVDFGGTGATTVDGARHNLGLATNHSPVFAGIDLQGLNGTTSGIMVLRNRNPDLTQVSYSRIYHEIQNGVAKTTIQTTREGAGTNYLQVDEAGHVGNVGSICIGMQNHALGSNAIAIGDTDSGIRWSSDGVIQAVSNGTNALAWTPTNVTIYKPMLFWVDNTSRPIYVHGVRSRGENALIAGPVEAGGHVAWRDRASGMLVEIPSRGGAVNIWKATRWGDQHACASDIVIYEDGSPYQRILVGGGEYGFNGAGTATAAQWLSTSDIRLKAQLKEIKSAKEKVKSIKGYTYFKRNNLEEDEYSFYSEEAGVIAQDVQTVLPEAVYKISNTDFLGVSYSGVTALLVNAINEMIDDEDVQSKRIEALEDEVTALKSELTDLKVLVASLVKSPAILKGE